MVLLYLVKWTLFNFGQFSAKSASGCTRANCWLFLELSVGQCKTFAKEEIAKNNNSQNFQQKPQFFRETENLFKF